jgi:hypothetical protein
MSVIWIGLVFLSSGFSDPYTDHAVITFRSKKPYGETHIPYHLVGEVPAVNVTWNGRKTECFLDTGTTGVLTYTGMKLPGKDLGDGGPYAWAGGGVSHCRLVRINLQIGGISFRNAIGYSVDNEMIPVADWVSELPILGDSFLERFCVTFDPRKHEIIFRTPNYDPNTAGATALEMHPETLIPWVYGRLNGKAARLSIDTSSSEEFVINQDSAKKYFMNLPKVGTGSNDEQDERYYRKPFYVRSGPIMATARTSPVGPIAALADAIIGWPLLNRFEMTLDYRRGHLILRSLM